MAYQFPADIQQSITAYVTSGSFPNEEQVLREAMRLLALQQEDLASIQRGFEDISNGRTQLADESNGEFRRIHKIPSPS